MTQVACELPGGRDAFASLAYSASGLRIGSPLVQRLTFLSLSLLWSTQARGSIPLWWEKPRICRQQGLRVRKE